MIIEKWKIFGWIKISLAGGEGSASDQFIDHITLNSIGADKRHDGRYRRIQRGRGDVTGLRLRGGLAVKIYRHFMGENLGEMQSRQVAFLAVAADHEQRAIRIGFGPRLERRVRSVRDDKSVKPARWVRCQQELSLSPVAGGD